MRWPWKPRVERRETVTDYTTLVSQLVEAQASGTTAQGSRTAALEAVAGLLSRAFAGAVVDAPDDLMAAVSPRFLGQLGRDLIRQGESCHVIRMMGGSTSLIPCSTWYWEGDANPATWTVTATAYGPSGSETWRVPHASAVFAVWGAPVARPYHGISPTGWAGDTGRLMANAERALANETGGPLAQLLPVPADGGDGSEDDPLASLKADIAGAKGRAVLLETTSAGWSDGPQAAPRRDWQAQRLGPNPPDAAVALGRDAFARTLAACGCSPALFDDSDGTSKREALRQWHLGTVKPLARLLETELSEKLAAPIRLTFDLYNVDLAGRAQAFQKLVAGGVAVNEALMTTGLLMEDSA